MKRRRYNIKIIGLLIIVLTLFNLKVRAQQEPMFTQYMFNMMSVNPAYTGTRQALNLLAISRLQWVGIDGAPRTNSFSLHTPISNKQIGIGISIIQDEIGPIRNSYMTFNYAYRFKLTEEITVSMGLKAGINNYYLGLTEIPLYDISDNTFFEDTRIIFQPNAGAGIYAYSKSYYFGFAAPKLIQTNLDDVSKDEGDFNELRRHYYIVAGYLYPITENIILKPSLLIKNVTGAPTSIDISAQVFINDKYWVGAMHRWGDAIGFMANMHVNKQLIIGYSYDFSVSKLASFNKGTHELLISFDFEKLSNSKIKSPRYF